jgi:hypothetical protein
LHAGWKRPPLLTLSPSRGEWALTRVIASAAKQPRGLTRSSVDVPLGCFGAMRLAMTRGRVDQNPLPLLRGYFPRRGKIYRPSSSPSGGSGAKRRRGPCFPCSVFPAKAGTQILSLKR